MLGRTVRFVADRIPLFPLGTVLLPGVALPLHIFEPRYRQLTVDLVTGVAPGRCFGVLAMKYGWSEGTPEPEVQQVGCSAVLREASRLPDGRFDIVTRGDRRFRLLDVDHDGQTPYLVGTIEWLDDVELDDAPAELVPMLTQAARAAHRRYCAAAWNHGDWAEPDADTDPGVLPHLIASDCLLSLEDRQRLLEERSPMRRLRLVRRLLNREAGILGALHAVPVPLADLGLQSSRN
jgi:Lon protease-like protein